jgi:hypothetical protein
MASRSVSRAGGPCRASQDEDQGRRQLGSHARQMLAEFSLWVSPHAAGLSGAAGARLRAGLPHRARTDTGEPAAGTPRAGPADRVAVVADQPLNALGHGHVVRAQGATVPRREGHRHAPTPDADERLAAGHGSVGCDAGDEPGRDAEVVEVEVLLMPSPRSCQLGRE